ncbi:MAG: bifunctional hydroxymethylpyrimidine kinase/phosphomethylpyrimidine kinase [Candidatus Gastranaerophilales bacterium]|nr:bifunctional hydroxymethylpyrimidine kinase/phosphomethylpyrimidine kinase [Candidatus Gastranaerophilales bacterium]
MKKEEIAKNFDKLLEPRILVIGDFALDEMVFGNTERISREAPVLILEHYETKQILGAASNAANNVSKLNGGKVSAIGVYGQDYQGEKLLEILKENKIDTSLMVLDKTRKTTTKTRISGSCNQSITQQIVRIDRQSKEPLSFEIEQKVIENIKNNVSKFDGIILSDYHLGCLTDNVVKSAIEEAKKHNKIIVADIQKNMEKYKGVSAITPNQPDAEKQVGFFIKDEQSLKLAGEKLIQQLDSQSILLTRGENGMALFEKTQDGIKLEKVCAYNKKEVFDVTGAGDTVVAAFTLGLCAGYGAKNAMRLGNLAASIVIRYFGCHTITIQDLKDELSC